MYYVPKTNIPPAIFKIFLYELFRAKHRDYLKYSSSKPFCELSKNIYIFIKMKFTLIFTKLI